MNKLFFLLFMLVWTAGYCQSAVADDQTQQVDFKKVVADVFINPSEEKVTGNALYTFEILQESDSIFIDAREMEFETVVLNGKEAAFTNDGRRIWIRHNFTPSEENSLELKFSVKPKQSMYFINWDIPDGVEVSRQVWTQGQGRYTSHWLPSFDDYNEKAEFDLSIDFRTGYEVTANGVMKEQIPVNDSVKRWRFDMEEPMSSYLVAIAAGDFEKKDSVSTSGVPLKFYYEPEDRQKVEPTYRHTTEIFDFLEREIGVDYPWQNYKQIPVQDFLFAGMENTGTTIFANLLMTDPIGFKDRNYVNVNAHELAHQWFGNLVTATDGKHHWLHEGFATYYALLAEREIFGDDYYYWKLYETAEQLKELSDRGKGQSLLDPNASSLTFYQKGAWALHILREKVGDKAFREGVKNFLELYKFDNASTDNFIAEMESAANEDLSDFMRDWLKQSAFQGTEALNSLKNSAFITEYLNIAGLRDTPLSQKAETLEKALDFPVNNYIGQEVVLQLAGENSEQAIALYRKAFDTKNVFVRQAIATSMDAIPQDLKRQYESLLNDDSYLTIEAALFNLWSQFPEDRHSYLERTEGIEGFSDKNLGLMWRTLHLVTPDFRAGEKKEIYSKLSGFTAVYHPFEVREHAFGYLYQINAFTDQNLKDLIEGTQHHTYSFRNFCRQLLDELLKNEEYRERYLALIDELPEKQKAYLNQKLNE